MKIQKENIKDLAKILTEIPYDPLSYKSFFFFPINMEAEIDSGGISLTTKDINTGSASGISAGLMLQYIKLDDKAPVLKTVLAYADTKYAPKFDINSYIDFTCKKMNKKHREEIIKYECFLVSENYINETFQL